MGRLKFHLKNLRAVPGWRRHLFAKDAVPIGKLIYCWRHGFHGDKAVSYDFDTYAPSDYYPDSAGGSPKGLSPAHISCSEDKVSFYLYMKMLGVAIPEVLVENTGTKLVFYAAPEQDLASLLASHGAVVVKPRTGFGGNGVRIVEHGNDELVLDPGEFACTRLGQHPYAAAIYPHSVNTIRLLTAWDYSRSEPFIAAAVHRFGTAMSGHVDNWSRGGVAAWVDLETGRLGPAIRKPSYDKDRTRWKAHPDTGAPIEGVEVPCFGEIQAELLEVSRRFPPHYLGWDIVVTPESWSVIEANCGPALGIFQVHRPLLTDPRLREFYEREGVL